MEAIDIAGEQRPSREWLAVVWRDDGRKLFVGPCGFTRIPGLAVRFPNEAGARAMAEELSREEWLSGGRLRPWITRTGAQRWH